VAAKGPVQLAATSDERIEDLFEAIRPEIPCRVANMDMRGDFDENLHDGWAVDGSLVLRGVRAETFPEGVSWTIFRVA